MACPPIDPRYREHRPRWEGADGLWEHAAGPAMSTIIPADGCADLIVRLDRGGQVTAAMHAPTLTAQPVRVPAGQRLIGVRLRPGYGMQAMAHGTTLRTQTLHAARHGLQSADLEGLLGCLLAEYSPPPLVEEFLAFVTETEGRVRLRACPSLARAERSLQRAAQRFLGTSPKHFMRIARARAAQRAICGTTPLAAIAADHGYADQAHMTRECRALLGRTPAQLRHVANLQDGITPAP